MAYSHPSRDKTFDLYFSNSLETQTRAKREQRNNATFHDHTPYRTTKLLFNWIAKNDGTIGNNSALSSGNKAYFHNYNKMCLILREMLQYPCILLFP